MATHPLIIVGAGGFGREVVAIVHAMNSVRHEWELLGVADDMPAPSAVSQLSSARTVHIGPVDGVLRGRAPNTHVVVAIGNPQLREKIVARLPSDTWFATLVHPTATIGTGVTIGPGSVVAPGARLSVDIALGQHVQVDQNATIGHDVRLDEFARINPAACVSGGVTIGKGGYIGANATILQDLHVASGAIVGAGAVVVRDVASHATVKGVPAT